MVDLDTTFEEYEDVRHSDVVRDVFTLRQEVARLALDKARAEADLHAMRSDSQAALNWFRRFLYRSIEDRKAQAAESLEVLRLVRDTTLAPDDRLAAIEELLTDDPEDPDDAY